MAKCNIPNCNLPIHAKGYCNNHYRRFMRHGTTENLKKKPNEIIFQKDYAEIILRTKKHKFKAKTFISLEDINKIKGKILWLGGDGYCHIKLENRIEKLHRFILGLKPKDRLIADHINRNKLDNKKSNLRIVDSLMSSMNKGIYKNNTSGYQGVKFNKFKGKWEVQVQIRKIRKTITCNSLSQAIKERNSLLKPIIKELFG